MSNLQIVKITASFHKLRFVKTGGKDKIFGHYLYSFVNDNGDVVLEGWTISRAFNAILFDNFENIVERALQNKGV